MLESTGGRIASVHGRYYAMDRDNRWERIGQSLPPLCVGRARAMKQRQMALKRIMPKTSPMSLFVRSW